MTADLLAAAETAAGLAVYGAPATASRRGQVAARLAGLDDGAAWLRSARALLPLLAELHEELGDLDHVVLAGPGRVAESVARTLGRQLTVLDDPDPAPLAALLADRGLLCRSVTVLGPDSDDLRRVLRGAYLGFGLTEAETDRHFLTFTGDDALTAGEGLELVAAAALAGIDVSELLDQAGRLLPSLTGDGDNPALALGLALAGADAVALVPDGSAFEGLGDWAAPLLSRAGVLPAAVEGPGVLTISYGGSRPPPGARGGRQRSTRRAAARLVVGGRRGRAPAPHTVTRLPVRAPSFILRRRLGGDLRHWRGRGESPFRAPGVHGRHPRPSLHRGRSGPAERRRDGRALLAARRRHRPAGRAGPASAPGRRPALRLVSADHRRGRGGRRGAGPAVHGGRCPGRPGRRRPGGPDPGRTPGAVVAPDRPGAGHPTTACRCAHVAGLTLLVTLRDDEKLAGWVTWVIRCAPHRTDGSPGSRSRALW
ncbi:hypothetical protein AB0J80_19050 [Actinoplanes sp. NPDC049548]|uniref:hypothetical protein n=1 Tax=Actinoplanes sp. NPDC049548 TaxID=3155152 RepID=UPI00342786B0